MPLSDLKYLIFLLLAMIVYSLSSRFVRPFILLTLSIIFYCFFNIYWLIILMIYFLINYKIANELLKGSIRRQKIIYLIGILYNIISLVLLKYSFFSDKIEALINNQLINNDENLIKIILPLGFSFIVFSNLSYLIEIKRKRIIPLTNIIDYLNYQLFFPKISQGPIERPNKLISQIVKYSRPTLYNVYEGITQIIIGLFKKLVVADRLAIYVNSVFDNYLSHSSLTLIIATFFYGIQIYSDFCGYTDIALGSARLFGIQLSNNFRRPYFADSVKEFWNRWHITLSQWLRDYLFLPLAYYLSSKFPKQKFLNVNSENIIYFISTMITFLICGMWHGNNFNFLVWGSIFGLVLTISHITRKSRRNLFKKSFFNLFGRKILSIIHTFLIINFAWIFFRSIDFNMSLAILKKISYMNISIYIGSQDQFFYCFLGIIVLFIIDFIHEFHPILLNKNRDSIVISSLSYALLICLIILFGVLDGGQFIYYKF